MLSLVEAADLVVSVATGPSVHLQVEIRWRKEKMCLDIRLHRPLASTCDAGFCFTGAEGEAALEDRISAPTFKATSKLSLAILVGAIQLDDTLCRLAGPLPLGGLIPPS